MPATEANEKQINVRLSQQLYDALVARQRKEEAKTLIRSSLAAVARAIIAEGLTRKKR